MCVKRQWFLHHQCKPGYIKQAAGETHISRDQPTCAPRLPMREAKKLQASIVHESLPGFWEGFPSLDVNEMLPTT